MKVIPDTVVPWASDDLRYSGITFQVRTDDLRDETMTIYRNDFRLPESHLAHSIGVRCAEALFREAAASIKKGAVSKARK